MTHDPQSPIAIIGAGIGGLTLYHALRQRGMTAALYEAAPALHEIGAGIAVPSNAMQILTKLGREHTPIR